MWRKFKGWVKKRFKRKPHKPRVMIASSKQVMIKGETLSIQINSIKNFSTKQQDFYIVALKITVAVLNTVAFKREALNAYMTHRNTRSKLTRNNIISRSRIYEMLLSGADNVNPEQDGDLDISIVLYKKNNRVIGYRRTRSKITYLNSKFFRMNNKGIATIGSNAIHEQLHKLGFKHAKKHYTRNEVPYVYGKIMYRLILNYLNNRF